MGTTIKKTAEVIKTCPNQENHIKELMDKFRADPTVYPIFPFTPRHESSAFCEQCGAKLVNKTIEHEETICERCGEAIYDGDSYCPHCGDKIR